MFSKHARPGGGERHRLIHENLSGTQCAFLPSQTHARERERETGEKEPRKGGETLVEQLHGDLTDKSGGGEVERNHPPVDPHPSLYVSHMCVDTHTHTVGKCSVHLDIQREPSSFSISVA